VFENEIAIYTPDIIIPANNPHTPLGPNRTPITNGEPSTKIPGAIIFLKEAFVEIAMHLSYSGSSIPSLILRV